MLFVIIVKYGSIIIVKYETVGMNNHVANWRTTHYVMKIECSTPLHGRCLKVGEGKFYLSIPLYNM